MDLDRHGDEGKASIKPVSQAPIAGYLAILAVTDTSYDFAIQLWQQQTQTFLPSAIHIPELVLKCMLKEYLVFIYLLAYYCSDPGLDSI